MQFKELWSALLRRWYLVLVVVALAIGGGLGVVKLIGPTYQTQGAVLVVPPGSSGSGSGQAIGNPFLSLAGVSQVRDVVIRTMTSKTFLQELCSSSGDEQYEEMRAQLCQQSPAAITFEVTPDFTSGAPIILVTVSSRSPTSGAVALKAIVDRVPGILTSLQADLGLRNSALVSSTPIVMDFQPDVIHKKQLRAALLVGAGILGIGLLLIGLIDISVQRRQTALDDDPLADEGAPSPPGDEPIVEVTDPGDDDADWGWGRDDAANQESADAPDPEVPEVVGGHRGGSRR